MTETIRLTSAQALIRYLAAQYVERDGTEHRFVEGMWGIFGHGNVAGIGEALYSMPELMPYHQAHNEQSMVHSAVGFARMRNRLSIMACTSSIGPGATNMVTGAALATINRLPVLLLPGDIFASHRPDPVLQQLEAVDRGDTSVNDCFIPVSRYFDRIMRPEQLMVALPRAFAVLTSPAETGAVTLAMPQDVQAEAYDFPVKFFEKRVWHVQRNRPDAELLQQAARWIMRSKVPLVVAGGGVTYSEANHALQELVATTGIAVAETQAGKGSLPWDHPQVLGAMGATGGSAANQLANAADLVIGIGTRWSDFTTASKTVFQNPDVRFININVAEVDANKQGALPLLGDARATVGELLPLLDGYAVEKDYAAKVRELRSGWNKKVDELIAPSADSATINQRSLIGAVNLLADPDAVMVCAAGSAPGDLHKLWRAKDPKQYQVEYGYSCMGFEIAGGLGVKMAAPEREVIVIVGDGSYLMLNDALLTSVEKGMRLIVVLMDNQGFASIGNLSRSLGLDGFGTLSVVPNGIAVTDSNLAKLEKSPVDLVAHARSFGAEVIAVSKLADFDSAFAAAKKSEKTTVIYVPVDRYDSVPGFDSWWDVAVAEVSENENVKQARNRYDVASKSRQWHV